jgi:hypothetical protein
MMNRKKMNGQIFLSYRREDSRGVAGRLYDRLEHHFGHDRVFMDVDAIEPGIDFVKAIEDAVSTTDIFLVVIGPTWLTTTDNTGNRRLDNPEDFVRLEVGGALKRNLRVVPVLVDGAVMPRSIDLPDDLKALTRRNAIEISHTRFSMDAERLIRALEQAIEQLETEPIGIVNNVMENPEQLPQNKKESEQSSVLQVQQIAKRIPAKSDSTEKNKIEKKVVLIIGSILVICACCGFIYFVDQADLWCVFFPFISGCG